MGFLIDTQVILWLESDSSKLSDQTIEILSKKADIYFSHVSVWEMAIKIKTEKLSLHKDLNTFIQDFQKDYQYTPLPISLEHIYKTQELDFHHKDPFDRLIISQSIIDNMTLISSDQIFDQYVKNRIW
jgi:PIN domain nuclease of toxin-antitoxin system